MQIALTVDSLRGPEDVLLDCDGGATDEEIERALAAWAGAPVRIRRAHNSAGCGLVNGVRIGGEGHRRAHHAVLQLHVVSGPDSGVVAALPSGEYLMGRSGALSWNDPAISRQHLALRVTGHEVEVCDLGSRHGTLIGGSRCAPEEWVPWPLGETLEAGDSVAILREVPSGPAQTEAAGAGWLRLLRPPRLPTPFDASVVQFPEAPRQPVRRSIPLVAIAVPLLLGLGIAMLMRRPEYLLFTLASPLMLVANYVAGRRGASRRYAVAKADFEFACAQSMRTVAEAVAWEEQWLREKHLDAASALITATLPGRRLWERRREDPDFLCLRIGTADSPSMVRVVGGDAVPVVRAVPHSIDLIEATSLGITGPSRLTDGLLRWLIAQLAVNHAPWDLSIVILAHDLDESWAWLRWLPHVAPRRGERCRATVGTDPMSAAARVAELIDLIRTRSALLADRQVLSAFSAVVVVLRSYRELSSMVDLGPILRDGSAVGVYVVCTAGVDLELPEHTRSLVAMSSSGAARGSVLSRDGRRTDRVLMEQVSASWMEQCARGLAPFRDSESNGGEPLPATSRLLDLLALDPACPDQVRQRWHAQPTSATAVLGAGIDGPVRIDLAVDGPHALIAGTTGSGKTELLRSLVMSMALANSPDQLNFVLIDYKGDSAFGGCARLPHIVGKVNDLDPSLVERALTSLRAELDLRKTVLAQARATDIEQYHALTLRDRSRQPLPRLVIVIDEFAELARELPEFVDGLVTVAQLGRSLGVHLILATQRPSGVVSPAIRANTNIRIALRVMDDVDSSDVVGVPDAARLSSATPGRALLRLGGHAPILFQTGRIGCSTPSHQQATRSVRVSSLDWRSLGREPSDPDGPQRASDRTDLEVAVDCVRAAAVGIAGQRQPWLDPLPATLLWSAAGSDTCTGLPPLPFGLSDHPSQQRQTPAVFDLARDGHLFFVGAPRSGRSQALRVIAGSIAELTQPGDVHLYGLDCGSGALSALASLPHCGAVVSRGETTRAVQLLARLTNELDRRQNCLSGQGVADINEQRSQSTEPMPHLILMLDGWDGFVSTLGQVPEHFDAVMRLLHEGASAGVHLVVTGDRSLLMNPRLSATAERKYVLGLADKADYAVVGLRGRHVPVDVPPGRCFGPQGEATQIYLLDSDPSGRAQGGVLSQLGEIAGRRAAGSAGLPPFRVDALPINLDAAGALATLPQDAPMPAAIVGVGGDELSAFAPDLRTRCFSVIGPARSGRSSVLLGAALSALATGAEVVVVAPGRSPLTQIHGQPGVVGIFGAEASRSDLEAVITDAPTVVIVDDADRLVPLSVDGFFNEVTQGSIPGVFLMAAGTAEGMGGFNNWRAQLRKARQGLLLSPQSLSDGETVGVRLSRSSIGGPVRPGSGLLHLGDGVLIPVATVMGAS